MPKASPKPLCPKTLRFAANECAKEARGNTRACNEARSRGRETVALCRESDADVLTRMADFFRREAARDERAAKRKGAR